MSRTPHPWRAPLCLAALAVIPFLMPRTVDATELEERLLAGECEALPVLAHLHPQALDIGLLHALSTHADPHLRELVGHQAWTPHIDLLTQLDAVNTLQPPALRERALFWLTRRTTSQKTLTNAEIKAYWSSGDPQ